LLHATQTGILGLVFSGKLFVEPDKKINNY